MNGFSRTLAICFALTAISLGGLGRHAVAQDVDIPSGIHLVSISSAGVPADRPSNPSAIDDDGRFVLFSSDALNLVAGDSNDTTDVFLRDRDTDGDGEFDEGGSAATIRVSVGTGAIQGDSFSFGGDVSDDGRYVSFISAATNFVPDDGPFTADLFVRDLLLGTTELVSLDESDQRFPGVFAGGQMTPDGSHVAFVAAAGPEADPFSSLQVFVRTRSTGETSQVSVGADGTVPEQHSTGGQISSSGRYVVFSTSDENMVPGDSAGTEDVFVRDRVAETTIRINVDDAGTRLPGGTMGAVPTDITNDGRFVGFRLREQFGDSVWIHDRDVDEDGNFDEAGAISSLRVDRHADGTFFFDHGQLYTSNGGGSLSDDGRLALFDASQRIYESRAFVHDRDADADGIFDEPSALELLDVDSNFLADTAAFSYQLSDDGGHALWFSHQPSSNFTRQVFVTDVVPRPFKAVTPGFVHGNQWFLTNNLDETSNYRPIPFGESTEPKVAGDWDGDGDSDIGAVRGNQWLLSKDHDVKAEITCEFGVSTDKKVVGDWDGNGTFTPGIVRGNVWHLSDDCDGDAEHVFAYGSASDTKIAGDWDGDGASTPGVVRGNVWYLLDTLTTGPADHVFGYGSATDKKLSGDWDGDGTWTPGVVRGVNWYLREENAAGPADHVFNFGFGGPDTVVAGDWDNWPTS